VIQVTALHPHLIMEEIMRSTHHPRYHELCALVFEWHDMPGHDHEDPPEAVGRALAELKEMKLDAFARAGARYRRMLGAWQQQADWERTMAALGVPHLKDTAVQYVEEVRPPIELDFDYPA
jgi:hypothetical protein